MEFVVSGKKNIAVVYSRYTYLKSSLKVGDSSGGESRKVGWLQNFVKYFPR